MHVSKLENNSVQSGNNRMCVCVFNNRLCVVLLEFGYVLFRTSEKVNRLHCCGSSRKILIILNYSWYWLPGLNVKCRIYFILSCARETTVMRLGLDPWTV